MHKLISRLIRRNLASDFDIRTIDSFLEAVSQTLEQSDQDRRMLERSLMLATNELNEINETLNQKLLSLEKSQRQLEENLVERNALINATPEAILSINSQGQLTQINDAGCKLFDLSENELRANSRDENINVLLNKLIRPADFREIIQKIRMDEHIVVSDTFQTKDGKHYEYYSVPGILEGKYVNRVWCFRDITESRNHRDILHHQAYHDALTGLPNRALLVDSINHAISLAKRHKTRVSVLFIDLDDFKKINDTAGHREGDQFLIRVAQDIKRALRESDIIGRLGGDEFVVLLEGVERQRQIMQIHDRILNLFSKPFKINNNDYFVTCSIGISSYPQDGEDAELLIQNADMAMYQAKRRGKNTFQYFDNNLARIAMHRVSLESQLRHAIDDKQFVFHFQPKINLVTKAIVGLEALIRWQKPTGELTYPDNFIPLAEDTGLIRDITKIVVETACERLASWRGTVLDKIPISINISANDFSNKLFIGHLFEKIEQHGISSELLELELTESVFFNDIKKVKRDIAELKGKGLLLSIDDFGTGYSSFSYLHDLDIDYLKIDKSFVQSLFKTEKSKAIVKSIIDLGENLGINIVAEGVENKEDHDFLHSYGCHIGQGYHYSRPVAEAQLLEFIAKTRR